MTGDAPRDGEGQLLPVVWLVEDSALEAERARRLLQGHCALEVFEEGTPMLERLSLGDRPALLLLDLNLPGISGLEILRFLRQQLDAAELPVLMLTVAGSKAEVVESLGAGANDYVTKPYDDAELLARVTSQLRTQRLHQGLRQAEAGFRRLAEHMPDVVARFDARRRHLFVSPSIHRLTGLSPEHFQGRTNAELGMDPGHVRQWDAAIDEAFTGREVLLEFQFPSEQGIRFFQSRLVPERSGDGHVESVLSIARDLTEERRRTDVERQLIGIVSHDLKNPLAAILMQVHVALMRGGGDVPTRKMLERIQATATRAGRMVSDLLDFTQARLGGGLPVVTRSVEMREVVEQVLEEVRASRPERQVRWEVEGDTALVADGERLAQLTTNLLANALQYSPPQTEVRVRLSGEKATVVLEVHNHGEPIPHERLPRLFEPLQRASTGKDHTGRSVGLGLYIVHQILQAHGGTLTVHSARGEGTTFLARLPR